MKRRLLPLCGMIAPLWFAFTVILGGALRPGYSHVADTISELFSPGSPNKFLLDVFHTTFALLLILFGIGVLQFVRKSEHAARIGIIGAALYIAMGLLSVTTATIFPQDPWGSPPTFPGQMHQNVSAVISLLTLLAMLCLGIWFNRAGIWPGFGAYSFITIGISALLAGFLFAKMGSPIMGLAERITALVAFLWTFTLARWMFSRAV